VTEKLEFKVSCPRGEGKQPKEKGFNIRCEGKNARINRKRGKNELEKKGGKGIEECAALN